VLSKWRILSLTVPAWMRDARHFQILALSTLLALNLAWLDLGASTAASAVAIASALAVQAIASRLVGLPVDLRSPLITGLSLSLLLRGDTLWVHALAATIAIASKFILRIDGKHIWNPATFAITVLIVASDHAWISPGQWGASAWFATLLGFFAIMVLQASRRTDVALFFLGAHGALLFARAWWLGDPFAIPIHQLQSGSLLLFAFFMISDPRTIPDARWGRFLFALAVALLAHWLAFFFQMRPALYLALFAISPVTLLLDRLFPEQRFTWAGPARKGLAT
jgi:Na+-transporting NADH:ubiquinone oxidoreductase subunit NqrB